MSSIFKLCITAYLLLVCFTYSDAYKILVFSPTVSKSHMLENGRIADALARDGHNVTLLEVDYIVEPGKMKTVHNASYLPVTFDFPIRFRIFGGFDYLAYNRFLDFWYSMKFQAYSNMLQFAFFDQRKDIIEQLRAEKFDVIFYEQYVWAPLVLAQLLNINVRVYISSCPLNEQQAVLTGVPLQFSHVPSSFSPYTDQMTTTERFLNILQGLSYLSLYYDWNYKVKKDLQDRYGKDFPMPWEIAKKVDLLVINTDEFIDYPRPLPPNVIHIGGLGMDQHFKQELTSPYNEIMERGRKGVVYFSLGSVIETGKLPEIYMKNLFSAIKKFEDYYFIVKLSKNDNYSRSLAEGVKNVYFDDWVPQPQILAHPRLRLFITHGGYNSILEAAYNGVPVLGIGMIWDQPRNVKVVERNGWGLSLDKHLLAYSSAEFEEKITKLLNDKNYNDKAKRIQRILKTKPQTGEQKLLSYIRFLEQNDGHLPELQSIAPHMDFITYHNLDIIFYVGFVLVVILASLIWIMKKVVRGILFILKMLIVKRKEKIA